MRRSIYSEVDHIELLDLGLFLWLSALMSLPRSPHWITAVVSAKRETLVATAILLSMALAVVILVKTPSTSKDQADLVQVLVSPSVLPSISPLVDVSDQSLLCNNPGTQVPVTTELVQLSLGGVHLNIPRSWLGSVATDKTLDYVEVIHFDNPEIANQVTVSVQRLNQTDFVIPTNYGRGITTVDYVSVISEGSGLQIVERLPLEGNDGDRVRLQEYKPYSLSPWDQSPEIDGSATRQIKSVAASSPQGLSTLIAKVSGCGYGSITSVIASIGSPNETYGNIIIGATAEFYDVVKQIVDTASASNI
jgi:hypothetical protein